MKVSIDIPVDLDDNRHSAWRGVYVIRLDGSTCLQLWNAAGQVHSLEGDPLQVATWLQACHEAKLDLRVQISESHTQIDVIDVQWPADLTPTHSSEAENND